MEKKVDDEKLLEMLAQGIEQKEIAAYFGCSPSFITKRKKQLTATEVEEPPTFAGLTTPQKKFVLGKASGLTNILAVQQAYETTTPESAKAMGTTLMQNPKIQQSISELMNENGLTPDARIKQLKTLVFSKDGNVSLKALDQTWKLDGAYQVEPIHIEVDVRAMQIDLGKAIEALRKEQGLTQDEPIDIEPMRGNLPVL